MGLREVVSTPLRRLSDPYVTLATVVVASLVLRIQEMSPAALAPIGAAILRRDAALAGGALLLLAAVRLFARSSQNPTALRLALGRAAAAALLLGIVVYEADVLMYHFFSTRLYAQDVVMMAGETDAAKGMMWAGLRALSRIDTWKLILFALIVAWTLRAVLQIVARPSRDSLPRARVLTVSGCALLLLSFAPGGYAMGYFGDKPLYENVLQRNYDFFDAGSFSPPFRERILAAPPAARRLPGRGRPLDVIVLIVESLSSYQSKRFSGLNDWTPTLDSIAGAETALVDFHANGWTSIGGLISLLGGEVPVVPERAAFTDWGSPRLDDYLEIPDPLPEQLARRGYHTAFMAGGTVDFLGEREWLQRVGFAEIVDTKDERFAEVRDRGIFDGVPDDRLLDVAAAAVRDQPVGAPLFLTIATYWSHIPFLPQDGSSQGGEEPVIRATDEAIGEFYRALEGMGFFEHGILFVTGDHRAMSPYTTAEVERFGGSASTRVPAVVATHAFSLPHMIEGPFQHVDLRPSLLAIAADSFSVGPLEGMFLGDFARPARCIVHPRGDDRDLIWVRCGAREGRVTVDGDRTRFDSGDIEPEDQDVVLQVVNHTRARRPIEPAP